MEAYRTERSRSENRIDGNKSEECRKDEGEWRYLVGVVDGKRRKHGCTSWSARFSGAMRRSGCNVLSRSQPASIAIDQYSKSSMELQYELVVSKQPCA